MIFTKESAKLVEKNEIPFKLEKDLQNLVESNLKEIFNLTFLTTEFSIESYRFDTVAFNDETNSFTIIEYKRGKNESLVDQGYAYLYTLLDRKADFVLLYNEKTKKSKLKEDFDWSQTRIIFISPQFTSYQKNATAFLDMPFELFEVKQYQNNIVVVNQINADKQQSQTTNQSAKNVDEKINKVNQEIVIYTEDEHLKGVGKETIELYFEIKNRILEIGEIQFQPTKRYLSFKSKNHTISDIVLRNHHMHVYINLKDGNLHDPANIAKSVKGIGHWGNGDYRVELKDNENIDYLIGLIKQSYKINAN